MNSDFNEAISPPEPVPPTDLGLSIKGENLSDLLKETAQSIESNNNPITFPNTIPAEQIPVIERLKKAAQMLEDSHETDETLFNTPWNSFTDDQLDLIGLSEIEIHLIDRVIKDLNDRQQLEDSYARTMEYFKQSQIDYLTELPNRRSLFTTLTRLTKDLLTSEVHQHLKLTEQRPLTTKGLIICMLDVDHFKEVNDRSSHQEGDRYLIRLARALEHQFRYPIRPGRYGGEEFTIAFSVDNTDTDISRTIEGIESRRQNISQSLRQQDVVKENGAEPTGTLSFGVLYISNEQLRTHFLIAANESNLEATDIDFLKSILVDDFAPSSDISKNEQTLKQFLEIINSEKGQQLIQNFTGDLVDKADLKLKEAKGKRNSLVSQVLE